MRYVKWIMTVMIAFALTAQAQQQPGSAQQQGNSQQDAGNQSGNTDAGESTADTPGAAEAASDANRTNEGEGSAERAANTPAVPQTTSSPSGSPAVLSREDGKGRDGTNNVQRASPNMVGSPAGNLGLDNIKSEDPDSEMKDRQDYTQDKQRSAQDRAVETGGSPSTGDSEEINNQNRRENNKQSDQSLSSKEKDNSSKGQERNDKKSERKSSKKKDKG